VWAWRADARLTKVVRVKQEQEESVQDELGVAKTHIAAYKDTITTLGEGDTPFAGDSLRQGISRPQPGQKSCSARGLNSSLLTCVLGLVAAEEARDQLAVIVDEQNKGMAEMKRELLDCRRHTAHVPLLFEVEQRVRAGGRLWCLVR
jgi:hypothetical protein